MADTSAPVFGSRGHRGAVWQSAIRRKLEQPPLLPSLRAISRRQFLESSASRKDSCTSGAKKTLRSIFQRPAAKFLEVILPERGLANEWLS